MASIRKRTRAGGTVAHAVLYELNGKQTSVTFDDQTTAEQFRDAVNSIGAERAMKAWDIAPTKKLAAPPTGPTVEEWLGRYIDSRTGVAKSTIYDYTSYVKHDIAPTLGKIPLSILSSDDVVDWVQELSDRDLASKTIANRHGFLSAGLNAAVKAGLIAANPAAGTRLPRGEVAEMCFLTHDEYDILRGCFTEHWRPMLDFMVASGVRFGELSALRPADINRDRGTAFIGRAWKRTYDQAGYEVGATKTKKSVRTVSLAGHILDALDYSHEWLFTNTAGNPVRAASFRNNVWYPAVTKANAAGMAKKPRIHDMRHTCASWMIAGGASLFAVQKHLGHESIKTTIDKYSHLDVKDAEAAAAIIGNVLRRAPDPDVA
jgi:integrase